MAKILHTHLVPGTPQLPQALSSLPRVLADDEVAMAIYTHDQYGNIAVKGYFATPGHYEGRIAIADNLDDVVLAPDTWLGGDTGGFYWW